MPKPATEVTSIKRLGPLVEVILLLAAALAIFIIFTLSFYLISSAVQYLLT